MNRSKKIAVLTAVAISISSGANADFYDNSGTWRTSASSDVRLGYIMGIATYLSSVVDSGPNGAIIQQGYAKCLANQRPDALLLVVDSYMDRTPATYTDMPTITVWKALRQMCDQFMPHPPAGTKH